MTRFIEMRMAEPAAWQPDCSTRAGLAERDVGPANADGCEDAAFAEVQANAGKDVDQAARTRSGERPRGAAPNLRGG